MNNQTPSGNAKDDETPPSNGRRMLLDFGPLLLFFGANYLYSDLMFSVKVLVVATIVSLAASWVLRTPDSDDGGIWLCGAGVFCRIDPLFR